MTRLDRLLPAAAIAVLTGVALCTAADAQTLALRTAAPAAVTARATHGSLHGIVSDERGAPVEGVMVSALGATMAFAVSDGLGKYLFEALPSGGYLLRAHHADFVSSRREYVEIRPSIETERPIQFRLRRAANAAAAVGTTGTMERPVLVAGASAPPPAPQPAGEGAAESAGAGKTTHPHDEQAWRLRHLRRSILKDEAPGVMGMGSDPVTPDTVVASSLFARAVESSARLAATLFSDFPFSGELNLLTIGAFDRAAELFTGDRLPRGAAYISIGAPAGDGEWSMRAALTQGDVSSWILAGAYQVHGPRAHAFDVGLSYGAQQYLGGNPAALAVRGDGLRRVGAVSAYDDWTISRRLSLSYGGRFSNYDYIDRSGLFNPRIGVTLMPAERTFVRAAVSQRQLAPGAEEFLPPSTDGMWLPPERTFAPLAGKDFRVERARHVELSVEREFEDAYVVGVRRFYQTVDDQLVTLFGLRAADAPRSDLGHYFVATAGAFDADGWGVRVSSSLVRRLRGSIDYSLTRARWLSLAETDEIARWAPSAARRDREDIHDVTTALETDIPETATRVHVVYKVNSAYTRSELRWTGAPGGDVVLDRPGVGTRFDVQVNQALPFLPFGSQWEVLVAVRNLFRDEAGAASVYDELLVVRPPKRLVGGVQVKF
jgi:hypothetical protein